MANQLGVGKPLEARDGELQRETKSPEGYLLNDSRLPTFQLEVKHSGQINEGSAVTIKPLREPIDDSSPANPEASLHNQFVQTDTFNHSEGAFNN